MTHAFIGLTVLYRLTEEEALATNKRREDADRNADKMRGEQLGFQAHVGSKAYNGERIPMIITQVWPNGFGPGHPGINGQAILDGNDRLWVTGAEEGDQPGEWEAITDG